MNAIKLIAFVLILKYSDCSIYFHSAKFTNNPTYTFDAFVNVFNDSEGISRTNASLSLKVDFKEIRVAYALMGESKESRGEFDKILLRGNLDLCNIGGMLGTFINVHLREQMKKYSNFQLGCPVKKGNYYVMNRPPLSQSLMPTYFLGVHGYFQLTIVTRAKIEKVKGLVHVLSVKALGSVTEN